MTDIPNITALYDQAVDAENAEKETSEKEKVGVLRGGNSALLRPDGQVVGKCHRLTHLRQMGIQPETIERDRFIMFEGGYNHEETWFQKLSKSWEGTILREEDIPTRWTLEDGTPVTGRPDIVLCEPAPPWTADTDDHVFNTTKPVLGLEQKCVSSVWTARDVRFSNKPKMDHLVQSAHYMWQLDVPFKLVYSSYVDFPVVGWMIKHFPAPGDFGSESCDYNDKGVIKKVKPFNYVYDLRWGRNGNLEYRPENPNGTRRKWTEVYDLNVDNLRNYYEYVNSMRTTKDLGGRPLNLNALGDKENWDKCGYCPLNETCTKYESNYDTWLAVVRHHVEEEGSE